MEKFKKYIPWVIVVVVVFWLFGSYNGLVTKDEAVSEGWSEVENAYKRRADLIPNLVKTVKGYADFEQETLTGVIEARSKATSVNIDANNLSPAAIGQFQKAQEGLSSALSRLLVTVERYPELKANQNFLELQSQLEGTENRISVARTRFIKNVKEYNSAIRTIPGVFVAPMLGLEKKEYFQGEEGNEVAPDVDFKN